MLERLEAMASRVIEGLERPALPRAAAAGADREARHPRDGSASDDLARQDFVPNSYLVSLSPSDYAQFEQYKRSLERDLAEAVLGAARDRSFTLLAYPTVELEQDADISPGIFGSPARSSTRPARRFRRTSRAARRRRDRAHDDPRS